MSMILIEREDDLFEVDDVTQSETQLHPADVSFATLGEVTCVGVECLQYDLLIPTLTVFFQHYIRTQLVRSRSGLDTHVAQAARLHSERTLTSAGCDSVPQPWPVLTY